jgi:hypothetical protein
MIPPLITQNWLRKWCHLMDGFERSSNELQICPLFLSIGRVLAMQHAFAGNNSNIISENIPRQSSRFHLY